MTKTLAELQSLCSQLDIAVPSQRRPAKEPYLNALREHFWTKDNPGKALPEQIEPMLLGDWNDLDDAETAAIERDDSGWCVQEKKDGVRAMLHITKEGVRITGRAISDVTFRLSEFADNVPHLTTGFENLIGTILDGELICPKSTIDTGDTITTHPLQAAVAILATTPENARVIQETQDCRLRFVAFDVIQFCGEGTSIRPLRDRLMVLETAFLASENPHLDVIENHRTYKTSFHERMIASGKEGTVWKRLNSPYEAGRRVRHSIKRKKALEVQAVVSGFRLGTAGRGNAHLVGAVEFSTVDQDGVSKPIAWVSNWTDEERERMTRLEGGTITLNPAFIGKKAVVGGHDIAGKSGRYRHAKILKWVA